MFSIIIACCAVNFNSLLQSSHGKVDIKIGRMASGIPNDLVTLPKVNVKVPEGHSHQPIITTIEREEHHLKFIEIEKVSSKISTLAMCMPL